MLPYVSMVVALYCCFCFASGCGISSARFLWAPDLECQWVSFATVAFISCLCFCFCVFFFWLDLPLYYYYHYRMATDQGIVLVCCSVHGRTIHHTSG